MSKQKVRIVTDSTADLPKDLVNKYGITVVPLKVRFGDEIFLDGVDMSSRQFYERLASGNEFSSTSQPSPAEFAEVYSKFVENGESIISMHISSAMSGTYQSAKLAAAMFEEADIEVIDSRYVSTALGLPVLEAARAAREGRSRDEILELVYSILHKIEVYFFVDTLKYLEHGGRIGKATAFLGTMLNIKPMCTIKEGEVYPVEKIRGRKKALERLLQLAEEKSGGKKINCSLVHGNDPDTLEKLKAEAKKRLNINELVCSQLGAVVGTHVGPGVLGIIFYRL